MTHDVWFSTKRKSWVVPQILSYSEANILKECFVTPTQFIVQVNKHKRSRNTSLKNSRMESTWQGGHSEELSSPILPVSAEWKLKSIKYLHDQWNVHSEEVGDSPELLSVHHVLDTHLETSQHYLM